jgi:predicted ATPase
MALHTGEAEERSGDYFGPAVNRCARLMTAAHGGQIVCSAATAAVAMGILPAGVSLVDLGEHRLRDLVTPEHVFQVTDVRVAVSFPPLRSLSAVPTNLPTPSTRFVGRVEELARIGAALAQSRLVTLTGVGGVGKTRLALEAGDEALASFPDGVWFVELAAVTDPATVVDTVCAVLGIHAQLGRTSEDTLEEFVRSRRMLALLDNCEHVIGEAAAVAVRLVSGSGGSRVLATSREGLAVPGERVLPVAPLALPSGDHPVEVLTSDAVRLFVERAVDARDDFVAGPADAPMLSRLCRRLDGIPLAIELAAARVRSISPMDIATHLDQRFRLLSAGRRTAPTRQQTLRGAIDWSYQLLDETERVLFARLSAFAGGFDLPAAEAVTTGGVIDTFDVVDVLDRLVDKSLVAVDMSSDANRYRLYETIRDYGWERLASAGETETVARRHCEYFATLAEQAGCGLRGPDEQLWGDRAEAALENLRVALAWAIGADEADLALRIVAGLAVSGGYRGGIPFGAAAAEAAALAGADDNLLRPLALSSAAWTALHHGEHEQATELAEAAVAATRGWPDDPTRLQIRGEVLSVAAAVAVMQPDLADRAFELAEERREVAVAAAEAYQMIQSLVFRAPLTNDVDAGAEALRLARTVGNPTMLAYSLTILALLVMESDPVQARALLAEAVDTAIAVGNEEAKAMAIGTRNLVAAIFGDHSSAARASLAVAEQNFKTGDRMWGLWALWAVASSLYSLGDRETVFVVGAWAAVHSPGLADADTRTFVPEVARTLLRDLTGERLQQLTPVVAPMTDDDVLALARARLDQLTPAEQDDPRPQ